MFEAPATSNNKHTIMVRLVALQNLELTQDARAVRTYRDEIDILKEKAARVDRVEAEVVKFKEKLNELDFFKARVEVGAQ